MPKTGTTALQARLSKSRKLLSQDGILYPETDIAKAHHFLALPLDFSNYGPRLMQSRYGKDNKIADVLFEKSWKQLVETIQTQEPSSVILSTEYLFSRAGLQGGDKLFNYIRELFAEVTVVAYIRQPSKHFTSALQQQIKYSSQLQKPRPVSYRNHIEAWEGQFPGRLILRKYERAALESNDIVEDFLLHSLGKRNVALKPAIRANETMSAEAAALMQ